jgi:hypothetical protein
MGDTWWVVIICPCVNVFSPMGGVTEADVGFPTVWPREWKLSFNNIKVSSRIYKKNQVEEHILYLYNLYNSGK